jgi:hypothetical protein
VEGFGTSGGLFWYEWCVDMVRRWIVLVLRVCEYGTKVDNFGTSARDRKVDSFGTSTRAKGGQFWY